MQFPIKMKVTGLLGLLFACALISGCSMTQNSSGKDMANLKSDQSYSYPLRERACLERAMFFEANRSSREGLVAVGTVVMNRVNSSQYPDTICRVVGQKNQFAPGVLTRLMNRKILPDVQAAAEAVLKGERHPKLKNSMFFHTAGLKFPYNNMHYVLVAGGNAFYEKRHRDGTLSVPVDDKPYDVSYAFAQEHVGALPVAEKPALDSKTTLAAVHAPLVVPVSKPRAMESAHLALGYTLPEARQTNLIGALLLAQQYKNP